MVQTDSRVAPSMVWSHSTWELLPQDRGRASVLAEACGLEPLVAQCLLHRGITDARSAARFFSPDLASLDDPLLLPDMPLAVRRLRAALAAGEPIALFGDSDVDGITATAILFEWLTAHGGRVTPLLSNRIEDGYGLPATTVASLRRRKGGVVVLIDCGTNQADEIAALTRHGVDTVILDHHVPLAPSPRPTAFVNPHRSSPPAPGLCSAGLALKLVQALCDGRVEELVPALDLAALGTLADYAPLIGDNRILVTAGLPRMAGGARPGLRKLCDAVGLTSPSVEAVVKRLVPRLNAAGRLGDARPVFDLLTATSPEDILRCSSLVGAAHATTKSLHQRIWKQACEQVSRTSFKDQRVMVVGGRGWHPGLMGPVAAQLAERYARPAIAVALDEDGTGTGSGRSIDGFDLVEALQACDGFLLRYGGHPQACGLTVQAERLEPFRLRINQHAAAASMPRLGRTRRVETTATLDRLTVPAGEQMERCAPFGSGNARPLILLAGMAIQPETARRGWLSDGRRRLKMWGALEGWAPDERYDVLVSLLIRDGELVASLADARMERPVSGRFHDPAASQAAGAD